MKPALYILPILSVTVFFLIRAEFRRDHCRIYIFKPISTLLVILVALLSLREAKTNPTYTIGILIGLSLSLGGDVALMFTTSKAFMLGLALFLLAHIAYTITFRLFNPWHSLGWLSVIILLAIMMGFYRLIQANLGAMKIPVILYMLIISVMVNQATLSLVSGAFTAAQAWMITLGAISFYISDMILAANRYWKPWKYDRISLTFYYSGQFLLALAASYFLI
ncbi:MAG: lysoplasmalogenase [Anaerolineae bacterium]|nr:lysoplasmalogenase [Anaerolineae bacterium]